MKKAITVVLIIVLLAAVAGFCLAAVHEHSYTLVTKTFSSYYSNPHHVAGCHNCPYAHDHYVGGRRTERYECSCGGSWTHEYYDPNTEYCPYSH